MIFDGSLRVTSPDERWQLNLTGRHLFGKIVTLKVSRDWPSHGVLELFITYFSMTYES